jgi:glycosyltransferase involved in cell wall biosynthesis
LYDYQFFNILPYSGISRYMYELLSRFPGHEKVDIELFMGVHVNKYPFQQIQRTFQRYWSLRLPLSGDLLARSRRYTSKLNRIAFPLWAQRTNAVIYHQHYYDAFLLPDFQGKRVLTLYDLAFTELPQFYNVSDKFSEILRRSIVDADAIITISQATRNALLRLFPVNPDRVRTVYLANSLIAPASPVRPVEGSYLLYVGQRFAQKNFLRLLEGFCADAALKERFRLVCFGGSGFTKSELEIIDTYDSHGRVQLARGDDRILATYYHHATALIYPSLYEGFGMPVLEAMAHGCPVVASNRTSLPEIGGEAAEYFDPESVDELVAAINGVVFDEEKLRRMQIAGRRRAADFSWERCAKETAQVYRDVVQC